MPALKLFISHSSRLDDAPHDHRDADANWRLLGEVCAGLKARYGTAVDVLVDRDGLVAGDDWNRELNLWLAECQAAVMLISRRALDRSDWVAKEAAILSWRRALDPDFVLIPVTIEGESCTDELATGFWGSLEVGRFQGLHVHAARDAGRIVDGVAARLGDPEALADRCGLTPLQRLQGGIARLLAGTATEASLAAAAESLDCAAVDPRVSNRERFAEALARRLLQTSLDAPGACFATFRAVSTHLAPRLAWERAREVFEHVRPLWVHPGAAAYLPAALSDRRALALCGTLVAQQDDLLGVDAYTLERYLQRAWPDEPPRFVPVREARTAQEVQTEIRRRILGDGLPPFITPEQQDRQVNAEPTAIVVVLSAGDGQDGLPDPRLCEELNGLTQVYDKLVLVFAACAAADTLPETLREVMPALEADREIQAFLAERDASTYLHERYGRSQ